MTARKIPDRFEFVATELRRRGLHLDFIHDTVRVFVPAPYWEHNTAVCWLQGGVHDGYDLGLYVDDAPARPTTFPRGNEANVVAAVIAIARRKLAIRKASAAAHLARMQRAWTRLSSEVS